MRRLTDKSWRLFDPWEYCGQDYYCKRNCHEPGGCMEGCIVPRIYERLALYEDIGLMPEDIVELKAKLHLTETMFAKKLVSAADVREKVRGEWMETPDDEYCRCACSECGHRVLTTVDCNFCPKCGAEMRGEEND